VEELPEPKLDEPAPAPAALLPKILPQAVFFLPELTGCEGLCILTTSNFSSYLLNMVESELLP
jgi:hypothetical protein